MGQELPKQYSVLLDKPLIHHTLSVFVAHPSVTRAVVVLHPQDRHWDRYDWSAFAGRLEVLRCGGATRSETVLNGLNALDCQPDDWIMVHDAARPCITAVLLDRLTAVLAQDAVGGLLAVPVADTLKRGTGEGRVDVTEPRENLWQAQTPQMFRHGLLVRALSACGSRPPTDEAQAVERMGLSPKLVPGARNNLKVTYPEDLHMAEMLLRAGGQA